MSTLNSINNQLQTLYDAAAATTNNTASTLTEQVYLLIAGYNPQDDDPIIVVDDNRTKFCIYIATITRPMAYINFVASVDGGVTIDWGDGSSTVSSGTTSTQYSHSYSNAGYYTITLITNEGTVILGAGDADDTESHVPAFGCGTTEDNLDEKSKLIAVKIGTDVEALGARAFKNCPVLSTIDFPETLSKIKFGSFSGCYNFADIRIPDTVTSIGDYCFEYCYTYSTGSVTIPSSVTSIGAGAFKDCVNVTSYHVLATIPPTLEKNNAAGHDTFKGLSDSCIIYVPAGTLETYQSTDGWSLWADYIQEETS